MRPLGSRLTPYRIAVVVGVLTTLLHVGSALRTGRVDQLPVLGRLESLLYDLEFRERGPRRPPDDVVIAAVDEKAIDTLGRFPWPRGDVAKLIDRLTLLGAKSIVFDVAFTDQVFQSQDAVARQLTARFDDLSLAGKSSAGLLNQLSLARADAAEAASAARELSGHSAAVRDVRARVGPLAGTLSNVVDALAKLKAAQSHFGASLAQVQARQSPDDQLAQAIRKSGRVVLGSFLLRDSELRTISPAEQAAALEEVSAMRLPPPTRGTDALGPDDVLDGTTEKATSAPLRVPAYAGVKAPLAKLVAPTPEGPPTSVAFFNVEPDADGVVRRDPLVFLVGDQPDWEDRTMLPGLDLGAALSFYDASPDYTRLWSASEDGRQLEEVAFVPGSAGWKNRAPKVKEFRRIPVDSGGQLLVDYYGPKGTMPRVSLADVWNGTLPRARVAGKVVIFGVTAVGTHDQRVTPFDQFAPGVDIHATAIANVLHGDYLRRPWWALFVEALVLLGIALVVGRLLAKVSVVQGVPVVLATAVGYHLLELGLFARGFVLFSFLPVAEVVGIYALQTLYRYNTEEKEKRQIRQAFQLYLTKSVMEEMLKDPAKLKLGGDKRVLTVLFSDIRGFTSISERLPPEQLAKLINEYLTPMTNLVFEHGGTLDKYIGDAVMAIYGAPVEQADHALRCCQTAVAMVRELAKLQERWRMEGRDWPLIEIGIGINSGPMVVGNMGADQRFDYTVLGDNVNLASRLEGTNKEYQSRIIINESTRALCDGRLAVRELGAVRVKGKREPVRIFELLDDQPAQGELLEVITRFNQGVRAFRDQSWQEARSHFQSVLARWPDDGPSHAYLAFCAASERNPPGEGWDGVYTMTHK